MPIANGIVLPNPLSNGTTADAVPVMANYNTLLNALNRALLDSGGTAGMNAQSTQIHNLLAGVAGTDAVNVSQMNTLVGGYLPLTGGTLTGGLIGTALSLSGTLSAAGITGSSLTIGTTLLSAAAGAGLVGFQLSGTGTIARTVASKLGDIAHWMDFGIIADGVTDDTIAVQNALNWLSPGRTLLMPGARIKISSTLILGNGTASAVSTIGNNSTILWGGEGSDLDSLINSANPWYSTSQSGTQFVWAGAAGGDMFHVNGPIHGLRWVGAVTLNGAAVGSPSATGAGSCFKAYSFSDCTFDNIIAVNWQTAGQGVLLTTQPSTGVGGNGNTVLSGGNKIGKLAAFSAYAANGECIRLDGYRAVGGQDFTVSKIDLVQCGIYGNNSKGLVLGFTDGIVIGLVSNTTYGAISGSPWGIYLDSTSSPFNAPYNVRILKCSVGQGLTVGGSTAGSVLIDEYDLSDGGAIPSVSGLYLGLIRSTLGSNQMSYPPDGKIRTRALSNGEGYYGQLTDATHMYSLTRQVNNAHLASFADVEFEAGAASGPTTSKQLRVSTTGIFVTGTVTQSAINVQSVVSSATVTPTFDNDLVDITAQAVALTLANPAAGSFNATAVNGAGVVIRIKDNGTARAITFGTQYTAIGLVLPATTIAGKVLVLGMIYNSNLTRWEVVSIAEE